MKLDASKLFIIYIDSHFALVAAENEQQAFDLDGVILAHFLSAEAADRVRDKLIGKETLNVNAV